MKNILSQCLAHKEKNLNDKKTFFLKMIYFQMFGKKHEF